MDGLIAGPVCLDVAVDATGLGLLLLVPDGGFPLHYERKWWFVREMVEIYVMIECMGIYSGNKRTEFLREQIW